MILRRWLLAERWLAAVAAAGLLSVLIVPIETLVEGGGPELRILAIVQPALLVALALLIGNRLAPSLGLGLPLLGALASKRPAMEVLARQLLFATPIAILTAGLLIAWNARVVPELAAGDAGTAFVGLQIPLATRVLYGGVVEEVLLRWGLMTGLLFLMWRLGGRPQVPTSGQAWAAISGAALFFGVGHLPLLALLVPEPAPRMWAAVVAANALPGLAFGWLYWRQGLEAAILAHALAHVFAWVGGRFV